MNIWQMDGRTLQPWGSGGTTQDDKGKLRNSIHPHGRSPEHRNKNRNRHRSSFSGGK